MKKYFGFTLAEVLITLGIIGVVAALTIPGLVKHFQNIVYANQLKQMYSILTQAFKAVLADNDSDVLLQSELWSGMKAGGCGITNAKSADCKEFFGTLNKYVKVSVIGRLPSYNVYSMDKTTKFFEPSTNRYQFLSLANGSLIFKYNFFKNGATMRDQISPGECRAIKKQGGSMCNYVAYFYVDVNGFKGPNVAGRDVFGFYLSNEGILYPDGGKDVALFQYWDPLNRNPNYWKNYKFSPSKVEFNYTGRVMEEGWKITY